MSKNEDVPIIMEKGWFTHRPGKEDNAQVFTIQNIKGNSIEGFCRDTFFGIDLV